MGFCSTIGKAWDVELFTAIPYGFIKQKSGRTALISNFNLNKTH